VITLLSRLANNRTVQGGSMFCWTWYLL